MPQDLAEELKTNLSDCQVQTYLRFLKINIENLQAKRNELNNFAEAGAASPEQVLSNPKYRISC